MDALKAWFRVGFLVQTWIKILFYSNDVAVPHGTDPHDTRHVKALADLYVAGN